MKSLNQKSLLITFIIILLFSGTFFWLNKGPITFDLKTTQKIQSITSPNVDLLMNFVSFWGNTIPLVFSVFLVASLFFFYSYKKEAFFILLTLVADLLNLVVKYAVNRPRPTDIIANIHLSLKSPSFPSSHVFHYVVFFGLIIYFVYSLNLSKKIKFLTVVPCSFLILLIPLSRVYLGVHWATDVIGAIIFGSVALFFIIAIYNTKKIQFRLKNIDKFFNLS